MKGTNGFPFDKAFEHFQRLKFITALTAHSFIDRNLRLRLKAMPGCIVPASATLNRFDPVEALMRKT